ncbi:serine protease [Streptomyces sp. NPDC006995]|uniref:S1 family peptidase n=1 Tax=unclassified Streptomyces TaxID=2593676 RepID=UPI003409819B
MQGRVVINRNGRGEAQGSGVVIAQRRAVTAAHVVKHYAPEDIVLRLEGGAGDIGVVQVESDQELDIAILHLAADTPAVSPVTTLADGERWRVSLPVTTTDPLLTGRVSSAGRPYRTRSGDGNIFAMQLHVNETIKDYSSYSGSAVLLDGGQGRVAGILVEQQLVRYRGGGTSRPAANVLYAVPMVAVLLRFNILVPTGRVPEPGETPTEYDVLDRATDLFRQAAETVDMPALPPREAIAQAAVALQDAEAFMRGQNWDPRVLLVPHLTSVQWYELLSSYRGTKWSALSPVLAAVNSLVDDGKKDGAASWRMWVVCGRETNPFTGLVISGTRGYNKRLAEALTRCQSIPGVVNKRTEQGAIARGVSPTVGAYLTLQWARLHYGEGPVDFDHPTLLRPEPRSTLFYGLRHLLAKFDSGERSYTVGEGDFLERTYYENSRVTVFESTPGYRRFGIRPAVPGTALESAPPDRPND